jgi:hypothetical protein
MSDVGGLARRHLRDAVARMTDAVDFLLDRSGLVAGLAVSGGLLTVIALLAQWRYWRARAQGLDRKLRDRLGVLNSLIARAQQAQLAYGSHSNPAAAHSRFVEECDRALVEHCGPGYVRRISGWPSPDWHRLPGAVSEDAQFAHYDTARRLDGLFALAAETQQDLAELGA